MKGTSAMNILETIKAQREKLDAKVNAAIAERDTFIESISETLGSTSGRKATKTKNRKLQLAAKRRWAAKKKAGKNSL
jgi:hypothetical protein